MESLQFVEFLLWMPDLYRDLEKCGTSRHEVFLLEEINRNCGIRISMSLLLSRKLMYSIHIFIQFVSLRFLSVLTAFSIYKYYRQFIK